MQLLKSRHQDSIMPFISHLGSILGAAAVRVALAREGTASSGARRGHWQTLPAGQGGQAGGDAKHCVAVDAAVRGQACPLLHLVVDMEKSFSWPKVEEG